MKKQRKNLMLSKSILVLIFISTTAYAGEKVTICHVNPSQSLTLEVSENALRGHMNSLGELHGDDYLGACRESSNIGFYPCNVGIKNFNTNSTNTTHDYVTYSSMRIGGEQQEAVLEANRNSYHSAFTTVQAFENKLLEVKINLSSELMGTDYFVDYCFDGRADKNAKGLLIEDVAHVSSSPYPINISMELLCDTQNRTNGQVDLSRVSLNNGFPLSFNKVPEFCLLRFNVLETNIGESRNWSQSFNRISTFIDSEIISQ